MANIQDDQNVCAPDDYGTKKPTQKYFKQDNHNFTAILHGCVLKFIAYSVPCN
jgi:hypothetical protein